MSVKIYKIRKSFLIPLSIDTFFLFVLLVIAFFTGSQPAEKIILSIILIPVLYVLSEVIVRETTIGIEGITIKKLLRKKKINWENITTVDTVILRKKVFLTLTTTKGFYVVSNSYGNFAGLVRDVVEQLSDGIVEERVKDFIKNPIHKISDIVGAWVAAFFLLAIIYMKMFIS